MEPVHAQTPAPIRAPLILAAVFIIAACGLIYELLAGTLASYLLGDSVTQFSTIIGLYLSALGIGAWLSRSIEKNLAARFVEIEIAVAVVGGVSAALLFLTFARAAVFRPFLYLIVLAVGTLVGLEIPLLMRILETRYDLKDLVSRVLTFDYLGALVASLAFPLFLVPQLGLIQGAFATGLLNDIVALWSTFLLGPTIANRARTFALQVACVIVGAFLAAGMAMSERLNRMFEEDIYLEPILHASSSSYQRIVLTGTAKVFKLWLNGIVQFNSHDEHVYHEALVHPAFSLAHARSASTAPPRRVLILGGGDGLAVREVLRYRTVEQITVVDLDPAMTELGATHPLFRALNGGALDDPRVHVVNQDAMIWVQERPAGETWDVILVDFPDPNNFSLGKLYSTRFFGSVRRLLSQTGALSIQASSPLATRQAYWCVVSTMEAAGFSSRAYNVRIPSFGAWGFVLAARSPFPVPDTIRAPSLRFLTPSMLPELFNFPEPMARVDVEINRLDNQRLVRYFEDEWSRVRAQEEERFRSRSAPSSGPTR